MQLGVLFRKRWRKMIDIEGDFVILFVSCGRNTREVESRDTAGEEQCT